MVLHFVGVKPGKDDDRFYRAVRVFGYPDFIHPKWDYRAKSEILPEDVAVFFSGTENDEPSFYPYTEQDMHNYMRNR